MKIPLYIVDAFTSTVFGGNPAAICVLDDWPDTVLLQNIAAENFLPETAFLVKREGYYDLRWFTPVVEMDLCGHATLASAFVIFSYLDHSTDSVAFETKSGRLTVERSGHQLSMHLPSRKPDSIENAEMSAILSDALGIAPVDLLAARDLLAVFESESQIRDMTPDMEKLKQIKDYFAVIVTAPGDMVDFVSRFFAPNAGIPEDPVTGSAHCTLIPYWVQRLGKSEMNARQLSARGGELFCEDRGEQVKISGEAVLFSKGEIWL
ncbi:PhzF family phenazine biosynthesis protein [Candidatus Latescibacterota bacterium]